MLIGPLCPHFPAASTVPQLGGCNRHNITVSKVDEQACVVELQEPAKALALGKDHLSHGLAAVLRLTPHSPSNCRSADLPTHKVQHQSTAAFSCTAGLNVSVAARTYGLRCVTTGRVHVLKHWLEEGHSLPFQALARLPANQFRLV